MRDNLHEDLFADHAWQEMHKILDREMPERKRREGFWLWFLPALGLCVLLGRDTLLEGKIPVAKEKTQQNQPAIAQVEKHTVQNADKHSETNPEEPTLETVLHAESNAEAISALEPAQGAKKSQRPGKYKLNIEKQLLQNRQVIAVQSSSSGDPIPANGFTNETSSTIAPAADEVKNSGTNKGETVHPINEEMAVEQLSATEVLNPRQAVLNPHQSGMEKVSIRHQRAKPKLEWWAEAGTQMSPGVKGLSGYKVGILSGIPIGRMRLHTGLNYEMTEVKIQSIQRDLVTGQENIGGVKLADAGRTSTAISAGQNNGENVSSIQFQLVNLNLSLYHPIGKRFGVALGGNLHYLEGIKLGEQYLRSNFFDYDVNSVQFSTSVGNSITQPQNNNLSKNSFRSFGFSAQGAVSYRIATRWSASLAYRQSLQHFTKTNDLLLKPSWVDLGLRYRIK